jgi:hypothetical protein
MTPVFIVSCKDIETVDYKNDVAIVEFLKVAQGSILIYLVGNRNKPAVQKLSIEFCEIMSKVSDNRILTTLLEY